MNQLVAFPTAHPGGLDAELGAHFGHCDIYTLVEVVEGQVSETRTIPNVPHQQGGCMAPVMHLAQHGVKALVAGGMGLRPLMGFNQVGIEVFFGGESRTVADADPGPDATASCRASSSNTPVAEAQPMAAWEAEQTAGASQGHLHHEPEPSEPVDPRLLDHASNPRNLGDMDRPSGVATGVGVCGDSLEVAIRVSGERIGEIRVRPKGCVYTIACASAMSELACGRSLERVLTLEPEDVDRKLGGLPEDHLHCARLAVNALGEAVEDYYRRLKVTARELKS